MIAIDKTWHKTCFKCGGAGTEGCGRTLSLDGYLEHLKEVAFINRRLAELSYEINLKSYTHTLTHSHTHLSIDYL